MAYLDQLKELTPGAPFDPDVVNYNFGTIKAYLEGANLDRNNLRENTIRAVASASRENVVAGPTVGVPLWVGQFPFPVRLLELQAYVAGDTGAPGTIEFHVEVYTPYPLWGNLATLTVPPADYGAVKSIALNEDVPANWPIQIRAIASGAGSLDHQDVSVNLWNLQYVQEA